MAATHTVRHSPTCIREHGGSASNTCDGSSEEGSKAPKLQVSGQTPRRAWKTMRRGLDHWVSRSPVHSSLFIVYGS